MIVDGVEKKKRMLCNSHSTSKEKGLDNWDAVVTCMAVWWNTIVSILVA